MSLINHPEGYSLQGINRYIAPITVATLAGRHIAEADEPTTSSGMKFVHIALAVAEFLPVIGSLIALVEFIAVKILLGLGIIHKQSKGNGSRDQNNLSNSAQTTNNEEKKAQLSRDEQLKESSKADTSLTEGPKDPSSTEGPNEINSTEEKEIEPQNEDTNNSSEVTKQSHIGTKEVDSTKEKEVEPQNENTNNTSKVNKESDVEAKKVEPQKKASAIKIAAVASATLAGIGAIAYYVYGNAPMGDLPADFYANITHI